MIDLHHHLLPGLDDGPADVGSAVELAAAAAAAGATVVVATPHVSYRWPDNDALRIADAVLLLKRALAAAEVDLEVRRGAEVALTRAVDLPRDALRRLRLGGTGWLLVECPTQAGEVAIRSGLEALRADGHRLLLAHPERIPALARGRELLEELVDEGARCQVTASALTGRFGRDVQRAARSLLDAGLVHCVASDAHGTAGRPPDVLDHLAEAGADPALAVWLTEEAPALLLAGEDVPARAPVGGRRAQRSARAR